MEKINSYNLVLSNLNERPYIHGTSIVKGILDKLQEHYINVTNFEIRLRKKLLTQPILTISEKKIESKDAVVEGHFFAANTDLFFNLIPTEIVCKNSKFIDESKLEHRVYQTPNFWSMNLNDDDDIHVCLNTISKLSNYVLLNEIPEIEITNTKQTWFVGCKFLNIDCLYKQPKLISIASNYERITSTCIKRQVYIDNIHIGNRVTIYT